MDSSLVLDSPLTKCTWRCSALLEKRQVRSLRLPLYQLFQSSCLAHQIKFLDGLARILPFLSSQHVRNFVSWAGNVASGWAVSDITICLLAATATLHVAGPRGQRLIKLENNDSYYRGDGRVHLDHGELVTGVTVPFSTEVGSSIEISSKPMFIQASSSTTSSSCSSKVSATVPTDPP